MFKGYILSFLLIGSILSSDGFKYPDDDDDPSNFTWGGKCESGNRQSPIEIIMKDAQRVKLDNLKFVNYNESIGNVEVVNNGHTINLHKFSKELTVEDGILDDNVTYFLDQIHFHWPSEHVIDNKRYSLEMHLVHRHEDHKNISEALKHKEGVLVMAVLFRAGEDEDENLALKKIFENKMIDNINDNTEINKNIQIKEDFTLLNLMPAEIDDNYFYYKGSLTTPPCTESVHWIVFNELQTCSLKQLDELNNIEDVDGVEIPKNNRYLQRTGTRPVFYVMDDEGDNDDNSGLNKNNRGVDEDEEDDKETIKKIKEKETKADKDDKDDDDDDSKEHKKNDEVADSSSLRYAASPITILLASILTTIGAVRN